MILARGEPEQGYEQHYQAGPRKIYGDKKSYQGTGENWEGKLERGFNIHLGHEGV